MPPDPAVLAEARTFWDAYDGSAFHMWRDGDLDRWRGYGVPEPTVAGWRRELTERRLAGIGGEDGWRSVRYLAGTGQVEHLAAVCGVTAERGKPWHRRAFVEAAVAYWDRCAASGRYDRSTLHEALRALGARADQLAREYRMRGQREALEALAGDIRRRTA